MGFPTPRPSGEGRWDFPFLADRGWEGGPEKGSDGTIRPMIGGLDFDLFAHFFTLQGKKMNEVMSLSFPSIKQGLPDISPFGSMIFPTLHG